MSERQRTIKHLNNRFNLLSLYIMRAIAENIIADVQNANKMVESFLSTCQQNIDKLSIKSLRELAFEVYDQSTELTIIAYTMSGNSPEEKSLFEESVNFRLKTWKKIFPYLLAKDIDDLYEIWVDMGLCNK